MSAPARYLFDEVFAHNVERPQAPAGISAADHEAAMAKAREAARSQGVTEGRRQAEQSAATELTRATERLATAITRLDESARTERVAVTREAVTLALSVARKLAPALVARQPAAEIEALLEACLGELRQAPHLVARVEPTLVDVMRERLDAITTQTAFTGRIVILGDPDIELGDGRIDWADGGIVRDSAETGRMIDDAVERYLDRSAPNNRTGDKADA